MKLLRVLEVKSPIRSFLFIGKAARTTTRAVEPILIWTALLVLVLVLEGLVAVPVPVLLSFFASSWKAWKLRSDASELQERGWVLVCQRLNRKAYKTIPWLQSGLWNWLMHTVRGDHFIHGASCLHFHLSIWDCAALTRGSTTRWSELCWNRL